MPDCQNSIKKLKKHQKRNGLVSDFSTSHVQGVASGKGLEPSVSFDLPWFTYRQAVGLVNDAHTLPQWMVL